MRLLREGNSGGQAKADAVAAIARRSMWVATWEPRAEGFRTLVNSSGEEALAIFSAEGQLRDAAGRFGWLGPDGSIGKRELNGKTLIKHAIDNKLAFVVVDIAADHALELTRDDLADVTKGGWEASPPPTSPPKRKSAGIKEIGSAPPVSAGGTYGAASIIPPKPQKSIAPPKVSAPPQAIETKPLPAQPRIPDPPIPSRPLPEPPPTRTSPPSVTPPKPAPAPKPVQTDASAPTAPQTMPPLPRVGSLPAPGIKFSAIGEEPDGEMLRELANVLRNYPEVEWAAYCELQRAVGTPSPAVGLRLDPSYRENVTMMIRQLCQTGREYGIELDAVLIDEPEMMRQARTAALVFFPWRPKSLLPGG